MAEWNTTLFDVQQVDLEIARWQVLLAALPAKAQAMNKQLAEIQAEENCVQQKVQKLQIAIRNSENEINALAARKKDFQTKTAIIRNNDEYKAALIQIELCQAAAAEQENKLLELMEELERATAELSSAQAKTNNAKIEINKSMEELNAEKNEAETEIAKLMERRQAIAVNLPQDIAIRYNRLRNAPNHNKMQPVFVSIAGGHCGKCKMKLTRQSISDVRKGNTTYCTNCGAILYDDEQA